MVAPTTRSPAGYRLYDLDALLRLELLRTLRELGMDLATIRRVLDRELSVAEIAAAHADAMDVQIRVLQLRRRVLRVVASRGSSPEETKLMHRLTQLSGEERRRPYGTAFERLLAYLEWATESARLLRSQISDRGLDQLVFTDRYRALLGSCGSSCGTLAGSAQQRPANGLVQLEVTERVEAFEAAVDALDTRIGRWSQREEFVVADSSFYIQNDVKPADVDLHAILDVPRWKYGRLLFPIVVVDELDDLKDTSKQRGRRRAAHTLGRLDEVLNGGTHGILHEWERSVKDGGTLGRVNVEIVLDPPGHVRLDRPDVEIIDRTVAIQGLAGRDVRLLTCDTSQHTRGRAAGLKVTKVATKDPGEEPDWSAPDRPGTGVRAQRRARRAEAEAQTTS